MGTVIDFGKYLWRITGRSFHGALRWLEILEAVTAVIVYSVGFFNEHLAHEMKVAFLAILIIFVITFFSGLFWAAFKYDSEQRVAINGYLDQMKPKITLLLDRVDAGTWEGHYRITLRNDSRATIESVGVSIIRINPPQHHLPVPLHCSHLQRPHSALVNLNPGEERTFDVLRYRKLVPESKRFFLDYAGANCEHTLEIRTYILTLQIHAKDMVPFEHDFLFAPEKEQPVQQTCRFELIKR